MTETKDPNKAKDPADVINQLRRRTAPPVPGPKPRRPARKAKAPAAEPTSTALAVPTDDETKPNPSPLPAEVIEAQTDAELAEIRKALGGRTTRIMRKAVLYAQEHLSTAHGETMLDDTIMSMRESGLSVRRIASELGATITEDEVARRLGVMYAKMQEVTTTEYRMLQVARLERVINMCYAYAEDGSEGHIELLLKAVERLNKMFELETARSKIEVEVITDAQAVLLLSTIHGVLRVLFADQRVAAAISHDEAKALIASALDAAEQVIVDEQGHTVTL